MSHAEFLRVEGGNAELVEAIKERSWRELDPEGLGPDGQGLSERDRALCAVADKMSATPTRMTPEDWQPLRDLGFDDEACLEVGHIIGIFNYLTRLADGFGLRLDPQTEHAAETGEALRRGE